MQALLGLSTAQTPNSATTSRQPHASSSLDVLSQVKGLSPDRMEKGSWKGAGSVAEQLSRTIAIPLTPPSQGTSAPTSFELVSPVVQPAAGGSSGSWGGPRPPTPPPQQPQRTKLRPGCTMISRSRGQEASAPHVETGFGESVPSTPATSAIMTMTREMQTHLHSYLVRRQSPPPHDGNSQDQRPKTHGSTMTHGKERRAGPFSGGSRTR